MSDEVMRVDHLAHKGGHMAHGGQGAGAVALEGRGGWHMAHGG